MKFGVREICDVVFKAAADNQVVGATTYAKNQPVLYIDTAKTSTLEGAATTVYATGGKGNSRLLAWEGEKTLTFTVEDALISPLGFALLTGAGLVPAATTTINYHMAVESTVASGGVTTLVTKTLADIDTTGVTVADVTATNTKAYFTLVDDAGAVVKSLGAATVPATGSFEDATGVKFTFAAPTPALSGGERVIVDFYVTRSSAAQEIQITPDQFAGYYYVEASTLFRDQATGADLPAEIIIPKAKVQSNFTFAMASTGDPSTFSFVMDAFPGRVKGGTKDVLCAIQILDADI